MTFVEVDRAEGEMFSQSAADINKKLFNVPENVFHNIPRSPLASQGALSFV